MRNDSNLSNLENEILENTKKSKKDIISKTINYFLIFFTIFNLINFIILLFITGSKEFSNWIRLIASIIELLLIFLNNKISNINKLSLTLKIVLIICGVLWAIFCIFFVIICIFIFTGYNLEIKKSKQIDYLIVLGTKIKNNEPGILLKKRLEKTIEFYNSHKNITFILSGGKTSKCDLSEADIMKKYLLKNSDITESQIITENNSMNTIQNLKNILQIMGNDKKYGLCTSNSHIYRAYGMAKKLNYINLTPLSSKGNVWTFYRDVITEFYCIVFECIRGNMKLYIL